LPQFYLAGFTKTGRKDGTLWVLDKEERKQWKSKPRKVAHRRDYYKIDAKGAPPDAIEKALAEFEHLAAPVIGTVVASGRLPNSEGLLVLVNCVALFWARVPRIRNITSRFIDDVSKDINKMMVSSAETYRGIIDRMRKKGEHLPDGVDDYEEMKAFVEGGEYTVDFDRTWHVGRLLEALDILIPVLMQRNWSLLIAKEGEGSFACSDSPVSITWTKEMRSPFGPGFAHKDTRVTMPLSRTVTLVGEFGRPSVVMPVSKGIISFINSFTVGWAERFVYSPQEDFPWMMGDGLVGGTRELLGFLAKATGAHREERRGP
jgi:hypothetical protein